jgi:hypothetical protein
MFQLISEDHTQCAEKDHDHSGNYLEMLRMDMHSKLKATIAGFIHHFHCDESYLQHTEISILIIRKDNWRNIALRVSQ